MAAWSAVTVPRKSYEFPALCPDCLRTGPLTGVLIPANLRIRVPFCQPCASRLLKRRKLRQPLTILAVVAAFAVMLWFDLSKWEGCFLAVVLALPTVWLTDYRGPGGAHEELRCRQSDVRIQAQRVCATIRKHTQA